MLTDDLEALNLGLPITFTESYEEATHKLYSALGSSPNKFPLFDYRERISTNPGSANTPQLTRGFIIET